MHQNLIILAGGMSSRMKKPTEVKTISSEDTAQANTRSKGLISFGVHGRPLLDYLVYNAKKAGYQNIIIVVNELGLPQFKALYGNKKINNTFKGITLSFAIQYIPENRIKPFGTSDAVFQVLEQYPKLKKEAFTVCNSDNLYSYKVLSSLRNVESKNALIAYNRDTLEFSSERISKFAVVKLNDENYLIDIKEKPSILMLRMLKTPKEIYG